MIPLWEGASESMIRPPIYQQEASLCTEQLHRCLVSLPAPAPLPPASAKKSGCFSIKNHPFLTHSSIKGLPLCAELVSLTASSTLRGFVSYLSVSPRSSVQDLGGDQCLFCTRQVPSSSSL